MWRQAEYQECFRRRANDLRVQYQNRIHFNAGTLGECANTHNGARRIGRCEILRHYLIDQRKMPEVGEKNIQFGDIRQTAASRLGNSAQVIKYTANLCFHVALH